MQVIDDFLALGPAPAGKVRVMRVENKEDPMRGASSFFGRSWRRLPSPWEDSPSHFMDNKETCATTNEQFGLWFSAANLEELDVAGLHVVALEIDAMYAVVQCKQVVINRKAATVIKVLMQ